ncbi:MAG: hypothetical protein IPM35_18010 [Myxococcales bacterium]|nr:hypothetical protein [Myxococcales bacterium]
MSDVVLLEEESALDLPVKGSVGSFSVAMKGGATSIAVQYLETHIGFATSGDSEEKLLRELVPVREALTLKLMDFDQIMQRDIDDGRVSADLIPYLLADNARALVKFFPPIIVVVLPMSETDMPADRYPRVETLEEDTPKAKWKITRSGPIGAEAFEFRQMIVKGRVQDHDYAQLKLNSAKCRLAIVDGQHRAMALLALYRNFKGWPDKTSRYQDYYSRWSRSVIDQFDLRGIRMPILLCTFPQLDETFKGSLTVAGACRSIFLALNKNAKPVTRARNHLLDDGDIIAHLVRDTLGSIKDLDANAAEAIRLWNTELDAEEDNTALSNPIAITGVMHLYGLIERMLLAEPPQGITIKRQNLWKVKKLDPLVRRLDAKSKLGSKKAAALVRYSVDPDNAAVLRDCYREGYGRSVLSALDQFWPYRAHNETSLETELKLRNVAKAATYHSILFEGQGIGQVFERYAEHLAEERQNAATPPPELEAAYKVFSDKRKELRENLAEFATARTRRFLGSGVPAKQADELHPHVDAMFRYTFTTAAFQIGLVLAYWTLAERLIDERVKNKAAAPSADQLKEWFNEYLTQVNRFFKPSSTKGALDIVRVFVGNTTGGHSTPLVVVPSSSCLKKILVPGELKPDEWIKFRYVFLELWSPQDPDLLQLVSDEVRKCRGAIIRNYEARELQHAATKLGVDATQLDSKRVQEIKDQCRAEFRTALRYLGRDVELSELAEEEKAATREAAAEAGGEDDPEADAEDS